MNDCNTCKSGDLDMDVEPCKTCLDEMFNFRSRFSKWESEFKDKPDKYQSVEEKAK